MEKKQNVPALRFQGFSGEWEKTTVGKIFEVTRGETLAAPKTSPTQNPVMNYPVYSSQTKNNGLMGYYSEYLFENAITWTTDGANAGTVRFRKGKFYCTNVCGVLLSKQGYANTFMAEALNKVAWKHVSKVGNPKLMNNVMKEISIHAPKTIDEQNELAEYIEKLDLNIFNRMQKIRKLQQFRQAMLTKLFPREGAAEPELRFRGFSGPWNQGTLGNVTKRVIVGLATSVTPYYRKKGIPIFRNLNIKENHLDDKDILFLDKEYADCQKSKQIHTGDVLTVHTGYIGTSCVVPSKYDGCLTFTTLITTPNPTILDGKYLSQYLNTSSGMEAMQAVTTQGGRNNLNVNDFVKVVIKYPNLDEQIKIAEYLTQLDTYISLQQKKLERMQRLKAALLEKLFV